LEVNPQLFSSGEAEVLFDAYIRCPGRKLLVQS